jgi:hypothetical protein
LRSSVNGSPRRTADLRLDLRAPNARTERHQMSATRRARSAPLERVSATSRAWPVRLQRASDGLAKAFQSPQNPLADFCIELGYPGLGGLRALTHCIVPRLRLSLFVLALAAKFLELAAKPLERLGVLA